MYDAMTVRYINTSRDTVVSQR